MCGCTKKTDRLIGEELFSVDSATQINISVGGIEEKINDVEEINEIKMIMSKLTLSIYASEPIEGGILLTFVGEKNNTDITICGDVILYEGIWYKADTDISEEISQYISR